jgi:hypothetical protein
MQLKGLHLEYFVTGSISILWLVQLKNLIQDFIVLPEIPLPNYMWIIICIPILYAIGLIIDYSMHIILWPVRSKIKESCFSISTLPDISAYQRFGKLLKRSQGSILILEVRKTRDRISRGLLMNIVAFGLVYSILIFKMGEWISLLIFITIIIASSIYVFKMWKYFRRSYYEFERELLTDEETEHKNMQNT